MSESPSIYQGKSWRNHIEFSVPWYGWVVALSPHLSKVSTVYIENVQVDVVLYGLAFLVILFRPQLLLQKFPVLLVLTCVLSLLSGLFFDVPYSSRTILDLAAIAVVYAAVYHIVNNIGPIKLFFIYSYGSLAVCAWGILEMGLGLTRAYGLDGLSFEPSHFVVVIAPAVYFAMQSDVLPTWQKWLLPIAMLLTMSLTGLVMLSLISTFVFRSKWPWVLGVALVSVTLWNQSEALRTRVETRLFDEAFSAEGQIEEGAFQFGMNRTTASLLSNWHVAKENMKAYFPFGVGFSSHHLGYERTFSNSSFKGSVFYGTNIKSAHNLAIRWLSEMGALGCVVLASMVWFWFRQRKHWGDLAELVAFSCLMHLVAKGLKLGSYLDYGTPFFVCCLLILLENSRRNEFE